MRRRFRSTLTLAIVIAGCSGDRSTEPFQPQAAAVPVPFRATCELAIQPPTPVGPGLIHQLDIGTCHATHLGRATLVSDKVINVGAATQTLSVTFTAANGDVLRGSGTGTNSMIAPGRVAFTATATFAGGTGRFAQASGEATITGEADLAAGRSRMTAEGTIHY